MDKDKTNNKSLDTKEWVKPTIEKLGNIKIL